MKLDAKDFKRWKQLKALIASGKASEAEKAEFAGLDSKRNDKGGNPVDLWNKYPTLFRDCTNIPFNYRKGTDFPLPIIQSSEVNDMPELTYGVRIDYERTPGYSSNANQGLNYQARKLWLAMHRMYRGLGTYEYADLGIAIWAIACAFSDLARAERIYGLFNEYQIMNRTVPENILAALNLDATTITGPDLADFRYELNRLITKAKTLCLPRGIGIVESFILIDSNVFKDSDSHRATWFLYDATHRVQYDATAATGGRTIYVERSTNGSGKFTLDRIVKDLNDDFDILLTDTDIARICSDMIAAIGGKDGSGMDKLMTLSLVPEDYKVVPVREDSRLLQLHNTTLVGDLVQWAVPANLSRVAAGTALTKPTSQTLQVYQDGGIIICQFASILKNSNVSTYVTGGSSKIFTGTSTGGYPSYLKSGAVLDIWKDDVTPEDIMEMTRQTISVNLREDTVSGNTYRSTILNHYGNIVCCNMHVYQQYGVNGATLVTERLINIGTISALGSTSVGNAENVLASLSHIDWHPVLVGVESTTNFKLIFGDLDNFTFISASNLSRLHDCAMISGWMTAIGEIVQSAE